MKAQQAPWVFYPFPSSPASCFSSPYQSDREELGSVRLFLEEFNMVGVSIRKLVKNYNIWQAVRELDLEIFDNEFLVLVGPSGCGKSTTLRMIAGLEEITSGEIHIGGRKVNDLPPWKRDIAMVFQSYALYPHMTVFDNIAFGLKLRKLPPAEIKDRVEKAAAVLGLGPLLSRKPKALSGGQRQRVAMGRAMVRGPQVFLFDEPLSNLDAQLRLQMRIEIKRMHKAVRTTTIYVTHDQAEAMTLADRIVVMNEGRIEQVGTPNQIYNEPTTRFVAGFMGSPGMNFLPATLVAAADGLEIALAGQAPFKVPADRQARYAPYLGKAMIFGIRPEHLTAWAERRADRNSSVQLQMSVDLTEATGLETLVYGTIAETQTIARIAADSPMVDGQVMEMAADLNHMHFIDPESGKVI